MNKPSWNEYFLAIAKLVSVRSPDKETHHGCIIVNRDNQIIATGYNGFVRGINDEGLPTTRPEKYPFMMHAEANALSNRTCSVKGATAYITGPPCLHCLQYMEQSGISTIIYPKGTYSWDKGKLDKENPNLNEYLKRTNIDIIELEVDLTRFGSIFTNGNEHNLLS